MGSWGGPQGWVIANDPEARNKFLVGIFWINLEIIASTDTLVKQLARVLRGAAGFGWQNELKLDGILSLQKLLTWREIGSISDIFSFCRTTYGHF